MKEAWFQSDNIHIYAFFNDTILICATWEEKKIHQNWVTCTNNLMIITKGPNLDPW